MVEEEAAQLDAKLKARERATEIARQFGEYCWRMESALKEEAVSIPFEKKKELLTALRVSVLAHPGGTLTLETNLGAILSLTPETKSLVSNQTGIGAGRRRRWDGCSNVRPLHVR